MSKFSKVSLFSGLNNLFDLTVSADYSAICGYTEADLDQVFAPELAGLDRDQIRSWCYIDDMMNGVMLCLTNKKAIGEIFNIGNPKGTVTISSLAEKIVALCKTKSRIVYVPKNYVDVELRIPSIEKAEKLLGFRPNVDLNTGIKKTFVWYKKWLSN